LPRHLVRTLIIAGATWLLASGGTALANGSTPTPTLTSPVSSQVTTATVPVSFNLPVAALPGSVALIFASTSSATTYEVTLSDSAGGDATVEIDPGHPATSSGVASFVGGSSIVPGLYNVTLAYQDAEADAPASSTPATSVLVGACGPGYYSSNGIGPCTPARPGDFVAGTQATVEDPCPPGAYSFASASASCTAATPGWYAPGGTAQATSCPGGTYCPAQSGAPIGCPAGSYCFEQSGQPIACPAGYFCPAGTTLPSPCAIGTYAAAGASQCTLAAPGWYVASTGSPSQTQCLPGTTTTTAGQSVCTHIVVALTSVKVKVLSHGAIRVTVDASTTGTFVVVGLLKHRQYGAAKDLNQLSSGTLVLTPSRRVRRKLPKRVTIDVVFTPAFGGPGTARRLTITLPRHRRARHHR
jgi:hypothetical protein